jgi:hypothetical protein
MQIKQQRKSAHRTVTCMASLWPVRLGCSGNWWGDVLYVYTSDTMSRDQRLHEELPQPTKPTGPNPTKKQPRKLARHTSTIGLAVNLFSFHLERGAPLPWCAAATLTSEARTFGRSCDTVITCISRSSTSRCSQDIHGRLDRVLTQLVVLTSYHTHNTMVI